MNVLVKTFHKLFTTFPSVLYQIYQIKFLVVDHLEFAFWGMALATRYFRI
jgi:hypothetical protein